MIHGSLRDRLACGFCALGVSYLTACGPPSTQSADLGGGDLATPDLGLPGPDAGAPDAGGGDGGTGPGPGTASCHAPRFCFENPLVTGNALAAVSAAAPDDVWAVGNYTVLRGGAGGFSHASSDVPVRLAAVHARAAGDVWAVGDSGLVLHYDGTTVAPVTSPGTGLSLSGVFAAGPNNVYVTTGSTGPATVWHYDGATWTKAFSGGATKWYNGIWGSGPGDIWAVGSAGLTTHFDGTKWSAVASGTTNTLFAVWGSGATDVYAGSAPDLSLRNQGAGWKTFSTGFTFAQARLTALFGSAATDVWALGAVGQNDDPLILHSDGTRWTKVTATSRSLGGGWAASTKLAYAGSLDGLDRWDGSAWNSLIAGPRPDGTCGSLAVFAGGRAFLACSSGAVLSRQADTTWKAEALPAGATVAALAGSGPDFVLAVGPMGTILRYDGTSWSKLASPTTANLDAVLVLSPTLAFAAGDGGTLLRYDGTSWQALAIPPNAAGAPSLAALWGASGREVWIGGAKPMGMPPRPAQALYRYDGSTVTAASLPAAGGTVLALGGTAAGDGWATGTGGTVLHYDGTAWRAVAGAPMPNLYAIYAAAANDVYFAGTPVQHYDGTRFTALDPRGPELNNESVFSVGGAAGGPVLFGGYRGTVLRLR